MVRRIVGSVAVVAFVLLVILSSAPARADLIGPCEGTVRIDGIRYGPDNDSPGNPVVIPNREDVKVKFRGTTEFPITDHNGEIGVGIGPFTIPVVDWSGANDTDLDRSRGTYDVDDAYAALPFRIVGIYEVSGFHEGQGQGETVRCDGFAFVKIEGNPLGTVVGIAATVLTLLTAAGVVVAGMSKGPRSARFRGRPVLGGIAGALFGLFLAVELQQWGIRPLDNLSFFGLPLLGLVLGLAVAWWGPLGEKESKVPSTASTSASRAFGTGTAGGPGVRVVTPTDETTSGAAKPSEPSAATKPAAPTSTRPTGPSSKEPAEPPSTRPGESSAPKPAETASTRPGESSASKPAEPPSTRPGESSAPKLAEPSSTAQGSTTTSPGSPSDPTGEAPATESAPAEGDDDRPAEPPPRRPPA